jgi:adenosylcobinamide-phosphate guanylyltransferase
LYAGDVVDALIMAGGRGERMGSSVPKPLIDFNGTTLIQRALEAVSGCAYTDRMFVSITKNTLEIVDMVDADLITTNAEGYVKDMVSAITHLGLKKTLVVSVDLPLLTSSDLDWVAEEYDKLGTPALAVFVPTSVCEKLGVAPTMEIDGLVPAGVNIVDGNDIDGAESRLVTAKPQFALNVNTPHDLEQALSFGK